MGGCIRGCPPLPHPPPPLSTLRSPHFSHLPPPCLLLCPPPPRSSLSFRSPSSLRSLSSFPPSLLLLVLTPFSSFSTRLSLPCPLHPPAPICFPSSLFPPASFQLPICLLLAPYPSCSSLVHFCIHRVCRPHRNWPSSQICERRESHRSICQSIFPRLFDMDSCQVCCPDSIFTSFHINLGRF